MHRPVSLPAVLVVTVLTAALCLGGWLGLPQLPTSAPAAVAAEDLESPLTVSIDSLAPSVLPRKGKVRISGTVTNRDERAWTTINLYPFISAAPMTTAAELEGAAEVPAEQEVGGRITDPGPYAVIDELAPEESTRFSFAVPRRFIPVDNTRGVYWFGVHALGQGAEARDTVADGRARTFLPSMPTRSDQTLPTALVLQVRGPVRHLADGRLAGIRRWTHALSTGGRLDRVVDFGAAAGSRPVSWLTDPAVPDAARSLAGGNRARSLEPTIAPDEVPEDGESPEATTDPPDPEAESTDDELPAEARGPGRAAAAEAATDWLDQLQSVLDDNELLTLPYADVDVAGAAVHDREAYRLARERTGIQLGAWGVSGSPVVAAPSGYLDEAALGLVDNDTIALLSDRAYAPEPESDPETEVSPEAEEAPTPTTVPTVAQAAGARLVLSSASAIEGGPGPDDPLAGVAMRQRILGEAALRLLSDDPQPLVVTLPGGWAPANPTAFFAGLDADWLELTTVDDIAGGLAEPLDIDELTYPTDEAEVELDAEDFAAASDLAQAGATLQNVLTLNDRVGEAVLKESLTTVSYTARHDPVAGRTSAYDARTWIEERLGSIHVDAPTAVILSSGSGRFAAVVTNDLDEPVSVRLDAVADRSMRLSVPEPDVEVAAGTRTTVLLRASTDSVGISNVTLLVTDSEGTPLGSADALPIRSNRVSNVIWLIVGTGVALLFGAIVVRLLRRLRRGSP